MKSVKITLTTAGAGTGPFNIYSNVDHFITPFETNIAKSSLEDGYISTSVPDAATTLRVESTGTTCTGFYTDLTITGQSQPISTMSVQVFPARLSNGTPITDPKNVPSNSTGVTTICSAGNAWTKSIHINASSINPGVQIYLNDGVTLAIPGNLSTFDSTASGFNLYGIKWLRQVSTGTIYTVNPSTGVVDGYHTSTC